MTVSQNQDIGNLGISNIFPTFEGISWIIYILVSNSGLTLYVIYIYMIPGVQGKSCFCRSWHYILENGHVGIYRNRITRQNSPVLFEALFVG